MREIGFAALLIASAPMHALAQEDYSRAISAAWCAGALGAYAWPAGLGATYLDRARTRHSAFEHEFFGASGDKAATMLVFENLGRAGAADCNRACAAQRGDARAACFDESPDCKRIIACLSE
jgi:hypothetical protein